MTPGNPLAATHAVRATVGHWLTVEPLERDLAFAVNPTGTLFTGKPDDVAVITFRGNRVRLRRLHDALGQALEMGKGACVDFGGFPLALCRDETLFSPEVMWVPNEGALAPSSTLTVAADTKHLRVLRSAVAEAMEGGRGYADPWGKERRLVVEQEATAP